MTDAVHATNLTEFLAFRATDLRYEDISEAARVLARQCVLDYFGVASRGPTIRLFEF